MRVRTKEIWHRCGFVRSKKRAERILKKKGHLEWKSKTPTQRTTKREELEQHLKYVFERKKEIEKFRKDKQRSKERRRRRYQERRGREEVVEKLLGPKKERKGKEVLIGLGGWRRGNKIKGGPRAPHSKIEKSKRRRGRVQIIDEFYTSKTCHHCKKKELKKMEKKKELKKKELKKKEEEDGGRKGKKEEKSRKRIKITRVEICKS